MQNNESIDECFIIRPNNAQSDACRKYLIFFFVRTRSFK